MQWNNAHIVLRNGLQTISPDDLYKICGPVACGPRKITREFDVTDIWKWMTVC